jgi:DNA repair photolyase
MTASSNPTKKITSGTKEWADYNVNCILGCYNDCKYCYAKVMAKRFGRADENTWKNMRIREDVLAKKNFRSKGRIMFPSTHDLFDIPEYREACFLTLSKLLRNYNRVLITTKPRFNIIRDIDKLFSEYKESIQFRFSISSCNDKLLRYWEPNAPDFSERLKALKFAFRRNYKTSVSIEPFLDKDPHKLISIVMPFSSESVWIGKMNYISNQNKRAYLNIRKNYSNENLQSIYYKYRSVPKIRFKDSILLKIDRNQTDLSGGKFPIRSREELLDFSNA